MHQMIIDISCRRLGYYFAFPPSIYSYLDPPRRSHAAPDSISDYILELVVAFLASFLGKYRSFAANSDRTICSCFGAVEEWICFQRLFIDVYEFGSAVVSFLIWVEPRAKLACISKQYDVFLHLRALYVECFKHPWVWTMMVCWSRLEERSGPGVLGALSRAPRTGKSRGRAL